jgi:hypothetical protein
MSGDSSLSKLKTELQSCFKKLNLHFWKLISLTLSWDFIVFWDSIIRSSYSYCLQASLDDPTQAVVMHRSEPSRLQSLALQLTDKVNNFVDSNERIFEMKQGLKFRINIKE